MSYSVKLSPQVAEFLEKLDSHVSDRIEKKFKKLKRNPFRYLESYKGDDFFKLRIGDYRALVDIEKKEKLVLIRYLEHRSKVYKRFG